MSIKTVAGQARTALQHGIYFVINPFVRLLIRLGVTPDMVTTIGLLGNVAAAAVIAAAAGAGTSPMEDASPRYALLTWAGVLVIWFSLFDMLDGQVARLGGMVSRFGAVYDSVLDRYCELTVLGAVAYYFSCIGEPPGALLTFLALIGSVMVSYVRARGEGMGIVCKIGFMQRPERVVVICLSVLITGIVGYNQAPGDSFNPNVILTCGMGFIAIFANLTAFARINYIRKALKSDEYR